MEGQPAASGGMPSRYRQAKIDLALYDLETDRGETKDVAAEHPDVVRRLEALAETMRDDLGDSATNRKGKGVRPPGRVA